MRDSDKKLNMANKRNKKIKITDIAILKVPYIEYKDIDKKYNNVLYFLAKYVLYLSKIHNNSNEVAITYQLNTKIEEKNIGIAFGKEHDVDPGSDTNSFHILMSCKNLAIVLLHNHPSTSNISLLDITYFLSHHNIKLMIMVTNKGNISYIVKLGKFNYKKAIVLADKAVKMDENAKTLKAKLKAANYFLTNCNNCGVYYSNYIK